MLLGEIEAELIKEEGISLKAYSDSMGYLTIGVGHRTPEDNGYITLEYAGKLLEQDIKSAINGLIRNVPFYSELDDKRQYVLISLTFNIGITGLLKFKKMLKALENRDYELASREMLDSRWAKQVKTRAKKLSDIMRTGYL